MSNDFVILPSNARLPTEKSKQIALILHENVYDSLYKVYQSTASLAKLGDYSHFFTVSFEDLHTHLVSHPDEFHSLLASDSWDGMSVVRNCEQYTFRWHDKGLVVEKETVIGIEAAAARWLEKWHLPNQGLKKIGSSHGK